MHLAFRTDGAIKCDRAGQSRRTKAMVAGVAVASAGVLAVTPLAPPVPAVPDVRAAAVELSAWVNPLATWQTTITNTLDHLNRLSTEVPAAGNALATALANPGLHAELVEFITNSVANPLPLLTALANFPATFGDRLAAGNTDAFEALTAAITSLPGVLLQSAGYLAQGEFLEAFGVLNVWLLVNVLSDSRQSLLDVLAIPGDLADSIGLAPLARVFDAVLNRGVVGNLGRALLTAQVTSTIQLMEILDRTRAALFSGDLVTVASELINAPALLVNALVNGYDPDFTVDYPPSPNQQFPGLLHPLGFVGFFLVAVPNAIATALQPPAPVAPLAEPEVEAALVQGGPTEVPTGEEFVTVSLEETSLNSKTAAEHSSGPAAFVQSTTTAPLGYEIEASGAGVPNSQSAEEENEKDEPKDDASAGNNSTPGTTTTGSNTTTGGSTSTGGSTTGSTTAGSSTPAGGTTGSTTTGGGTTGGGAGGTTGGTGGTGGSDASGGGDTN